MENLEAYHQIRKTIVEEKTQLIMRWLFAEIDADAVETDPMLIMQPGVMAANTAAIYNYLLDTEHPLAEGASSRVLRLETIHSLVFRSISSCLDYLVTPDTFLESYLIGSDDVPRRLRTLIDHEFYPILLDEYLSRNEQTTFTADELNSLLRRIDEVIFHYATVSIMVDILEPIYGFCSYRQGEPYVEKEVLREFFSHHRLHRCVERIDLNAGKVFTLRELVALLSEHLLESVPTESTVRVNEPSSESEYTTRDIPSYSEFIGSLKDTGIYLKENHTAAQPSLLPLSYLIPNDIKMEVVKKIFHRKSDDYDRMIVSLETAPSRESALERLNAILRIRGEHQSSKLARKLTEAITYRFHTAS